MSPRLWHHAVVNNTKHTPPISDRSAPLTDISCINSLQLINLQRNVENVKSKKISRMEKEKEITPA